MSAKATYLLTDRDTEETVGFPASLTDGRHPAVRLTEGFSRRVRTVGRCTSSPSVLGLAFPSGGGLRLRVAVDQHTPTTWEDATGPEVPRGGDEPRLVLVCVQRRLRRALLLTGRGGKRKNAEIHLDLEPDEVPPGGLALVEFWGIHEWRGAVAVPPGLMPRAATGLSVLEAELGRGPAPEPMPRRIDGRTSESLGWVSTGGVPTRKLGSAGPVALDSDLFVVNPGPALRLDLAPLPRKASARTRWGRYSQHAERAAELALQALLRTPMEAPGFTAVDLATGADFAVGDTCDPDGRVEVRLAPRTAPVLVRIVRSQQHPGLRLMSCSAEDAEQGVADPVLVRTGQAGIEG
ncbi:hypothetical protein [Actinocorallia longicatena]|uniref:Uncharacterized protein n=1 Tax=Actinocorallia longicatena TaxID=111803 RepID=A0ABP6QFV4_9ACTN